MKNTLKLLCSFIICILFLPQIASSQSTFSSERISQAIVEYVKTNSQFEANVEIQQNLKNFSFKESKVKANFSHTQELRGLCKINIEFVANGINISSEEIRIKVKLFSEVPVANKFIAKGEEIARNDVSITKAEVTQIDMAQIIDLEDIIGKKSKAGIAKGQVVQAADLKLANNNGIEIKKGNKVNILHYSGAVCIRSTGFALQDGEVGDIIKVKKDNSNTMYGFIAEDGNIIIENKQALGGK